MRAGADTDWMDELPGHRAGPACRAGATLLFLMLLSLLAPILVLVAMGPPPGPVLLLFPPWYSAATQLRLTAETGLPLRGHAAGAWMVQAETPADMAALRRLPALALPGSAAGCLTSSN